MLFRKGIDYLERIKKITLKITLLYISNEIHQKKLRKYLRVVMFNVIFAVQNNTIAHKLILATMKTYLATAHLAKWGNTDERKNNFLQKQFTNKRTAAQWVNRVRAKFSNNNTTAFCSWASIDELR